MKVMIYFFLLFISFTVSSVSFAVQKFNFFNVTKQLNDFFKKEYPFNKDDISIILRTPLKKNISCKKPIFSLVSNFHTLGLMDVLLICNKKHYYLTVEIQAKGEYIAANRKIPRGTKIQESDLKILTGRLDILPNNTYRKKKDVINRINLCDFSPLQPITSFMTRPFWLVKVNQQVTVIINGNNFSVVSKAKSLSNGSKNENIRVKTKNGKIINGIINEKGEIIVSL
ncbi:flagella basal-body P-ring formation protein FlgA precursor [Buchnera aphidicola str. Ak (Acyrthosiphon kondoi)]|uniref:Flagella basal body P-ring formation protein FlgA n=1 Tax=Buchnera aphidicola str. Ak (Acyrthosiphon kondoi) TaxID=1005090 RepID=G2LN46_9GAMM|nr:flagellar basal body P-ring formation chaperone FlgA [Buchnera aphidicola]AEO08684.1 flagella basal-body P-ring formation protein FlgA precursor [Buchnera aphidicola str. Ak (Acyrthosiphon kondoi)]WAI18510.1 MAG: flagellar basal body P-ring formation chaperone FlgA [Buchnera aphidicola (Acyrthosiphon caraganae)]